MGLIAYPASMRRAEYAEPNCSACMLNRGSQLPLFGQGKKGILVIVDHQESIQQLQKTFSVGDKFAQIKEMFERHFIYLDEDCWVTSAIQCYTERPDEKHGKCCKPAIVKIIEQLKPKLIVGFGDITTKTLYSYALDDNIYVERLHGFVHNSRKFNCNVVCTDMPHTRIPGKQPIVETLQIKRDVFIAVDSLKRERIIWKDEKECVRPLNTKQAIEELKAMIANPVKRLSAVDYETNSLRPFNSNAKLISIAISEDINTSIAFRINDEVIPYLKQYWMAAYIKKLAHNSTFERVWTMVKLGIMPFSLAIDTMLMMRVMDNRSKILSVKFLAPVLIGSPKWDTVSEKYIGASKEDEAKYGSYALNTMEQMPTRDLLLYNGIDSLAELRVYYVLKHMIDIYYASFEAQEA